MNNDQWSFALFIPHAGCPPRWAGGLLLLFSPRVNAAEVAQQKQIETIVAMREAEKAHYEGAASDLQKVLA